MNYAPLRRLLCALLCFPTVAALAQTEAIKDSAAFKFYAKDQRLMVPAQREKPEHILGEGFDGHFKKMEKVWTQTPSAVETNTYATLAYNLDDEALLRAHEGLFAQAGITPQKTKRYCVLSMYRITKAHEVFSGALYKGTAKMAAGKVFYGQMVGVILEGDSTTLFDKTAQRLLKPDTDILKEAAKQGLTAKVALRGAQPQSKGSLVVCRNSEAFAQRFQLGKAEPLFVEYTVLNDFAHPKIHFADARIHPGEWLVSAARVEMYPRKANNSAWDPLLGKPDLVITLQLGRSVYATSKVFKNTLTADWRNINTSITFDKGQTLQLSVVDKDPAGDDYAGAVSIETDTLFKFEPGQPIVLPVKDEKSSVKLANILIERIRK